MIFALCPNSDYCPLDFFNIFLCASALIFCTMAKKSITPSQKALVEFVENHPDLRKGKFSIHFTAATANKLWVECQIMLNSIPGPAKEWNEWRKVIN